MVMESAQQSTGSSSGAGVGSASTEVIGLDSMRNAMIANFEQADLDVPAFLRKRGDTM
jgi:hypothetical protein